MSYCYGPVPSRRLGFSLGIDLFPNKICSFDCVYCQLGVSGKKTLNRVSCVDLRALRKELEEITSKNFKIDYITISGCGEPTLHKNLDKIINLIKKATQNKYPVCVITNSSLLYRKDVRNELKNVNLIIPSIDAASETIFKKINRPCKHITVNKIIKGLICLRKEYKGKIWLEVMLIKNLNDNANEIRNLKRAISLIEPDRIQLNLPTRAKHQKIRLPKPSKLKALKKIFGNNTDIVNSFYSKKQTKTKAHHEKDIWNFLKRRPATIGDLKNSFNLNYSQINRHLKILLKTNKIAKLEESGYFYAANAK